MKIIDNKKDYYDYLESIYGIDDFVVYDHRGSVSLNSNKAHLSGRNLSPTRTLTGKSKHDFFVLSGDKWREKNFCLVTNPRKKLRYSTFSETHPNNDTCRHK